MTPLHHCALALTLIVPLAAAARAEGDDPQDQLFTRITDKRLEQILTKEKIPFTRKEIKTNAGKKVSAFALTIGTYKAVLYSHGNSLQYESAFKDRNDQDVTLERVNEWNVKRRYSRAFVDSAGWGVLQLDLDFFGGTNERIIRGWLGMCKLSTDDFARFVR